MTYPCRRIKALLSTVTVIVVVIVVIVIATAADAARKMYMKYDTFITYEMLKFA